MQDGQGSQRKVFDGYGMHEVIFNGCEVCLINTPFI